MFHIVLLLPIIALILFWILPLAWSLPLYLAVLIASALVYYAMLKAMKKPVTTGREELIGKIAEVTQMNGRTGQVRVHGEIWEAVSDDTLQKGDRARIIGMEDMTLRIQKELPSSKEPQPKEPEPGQQM